MQRIMRWGVAGVAAVTLGALAFAQDEPSAPDVAQSAQWHNQQALALAKLRWQDGWRVLPGGLRWRPVSGDGSGVHPTVEDAVTLHYEGRLVDGTVFDSSYARGEPATFPLGRLIKAWQMAVPQMGVGDTIEIAVPAELGYGPRGKGPIPGGATMFFKIELLGIEGR
ncbi:putative peptidyl-prolyl cis-trans isomerase [Sphingobium sp. SYK-6]|uniref:FKBP-type peptidyl-prolyl cis-trans isomerase n=1 Tax=Sphingobium sp. (strain NBRC 103272 / SYK-6) TaxID=627192 RepID=UPI00022776A0|nr:putative peptidyl-prolyl cis-trans isomerase [Sphingobium sp. SYK-6]